MMLSDKLQTTLKLEMFKKSLPATSLALISNSIGLESETGYLLLLASRDRRGQLSSFFSFGLAVKATGLAQVIFTCSSSIAGLGRVAEARLPTLRLRVVSPNSWQVTRKTWRSFLYR